MMLTFRERGLAKERNKVKTVVKNAGTGDGPPLLA